jgi:hypothetical protein
MATINGVVFPLIFIKEVLKITKSTLMSKPILGQNFIALLMKVTLLLTPPLKINNSG